jgi:heptosyltransferase II
VGARPVEASSFRRVLVRLPNWVGDVCFAAPTIEALAAAAPDARFVFAGRPGLEALVARFPRFERFLPVFSGGGIGAARATAKALRALPCDAALVIPRSLRAALAPALARIPVRVGFASQGRSILLTHPVRGWKPLRLAHRSAYVAALLAPFGLDTTVRPFAFEPPDDALAWADGFLAGTGGRRAGRPVVAFEPGGAYGVAKRWPKERYAELARRLVTAGRADVVLVGTPDAAPLHDRIASLARVPILKAAGATDLVQLAALLRRAALLVTNDTGPMHLGAAVRTPILALFGSTDPAVCGPRGRGPIRVLYEKVDCSPCYLRECHVPGHPCLDRFAVDRVEACAIELLGVPATS